MPSPPPHDKILKADEIPQQNQEYQVNQQMEECKEAIKPQQDQQRQGPLRRRERRPAVLSIKYEQTVIPSHPYQFRLQNASNLVSRQGRKRQRTSIMSTKKIVNLIEFPPVALLREYSANKEIHYLELWMRSTQPHHDSPSGRTSLPQELKSNLMNIPVRLPWGNPLVTPGSSGVEFRSIPISGSGHDFPSHSAEANSVRKTCGMGTGCKLKFHCRRQKWVDKAYKKPRLGNKWACPFAGTSHAKGSILEKIGLEVEAKQPSDIGKCARAQLMANKCAQRWLFELH